MAQLNRSEGNQGLDVVTRMFDPFGIMQGLVPWQAGDVERGVKPSTKVFLPDFDVRQEKNRYVIAADLPGVHQEDLAVTAVGDRVTIRGRRHEDRPDDGKYDVCERAAGTFTRTITLHADADAEHVHAELKDGVLTLEVPKRREAQPRKIEISVKETSSAQGSDAGGEQEAGGGNGGGKPPAPRSRPSRPRRRG
jgi:HSP20 family protein